ncbi:MAG: glycosyltransferase family 39 protein [Syntrophobacteraceae bacterium]|nr:glycosyltransferase family 39 protein [Desulfobacteraceae bacterium]
MRTNGSALHIAVIVALWGIIYLGNLSSPALLDDADTVHAEAVREMAAGGDWVTLHINNGIRYLEKAPFMYWMSAVSISIFGLSDWAMRFPLALFSLLLALLCHAFGTRFWGGKAGFYAGVVYVSSLGPFAFTRILLPDVMLSFFMAASFYFYLQLVYEPDPGKMRLGPLDLRCMGLFASAALAVLTKGLVGIIFVGAVILAHLLVSGRRQVLGRLQVLPGLAVFLLIAAPWHLAAGLGNEGFYWFYFVNEHFLRYLGLRFPKDYDRVPVWLFWLLHLAWTFPWVAFAWEARRHFSGGLRPESRDGQICVFLLTWILVILVFFSFSTTQEYYTFPTLAAFALLLGRTLAGLEESAGAGTRRSAATGVGVLAAAGVLIGAGLVVLAWMGSGGGAADLSGTLTVNPEQYALSFGHMHDLTPETFANLAPLVFRTVAFLAVGPLAAFIAASRRRWKTCAVLLALTMAGLLHSYQSGLAAFEPVLSSKDLGEAIMLEYRPGDCIVVNAVYEKGSSINYYTHQQVSILNGRNGNLWYGSFFPDAPSIFYDDASFPDLWNSKKRVFLFSERLPLESLLARHPGLIYRVLAEKGGKKVLVNR